MTDPIAYWNGPPGEHWVREQEALDAMLRPFGDAVLAAARVSPGEAALDVGCGCGDTSLALAALVTAGAGRGRVVGLDVSAPMVARAKERAQGNAGLSFLLGDAAVEPLEPRAFDLLFSRFGVMFFADPRAAFTHLRGALRPGGRLAFVCWRPLADNPWATVPVEAALTVVARPEPEPPGAPGPFAFGDAARVAGILGAAGFRDLAFRPHDGVMNVGTGSAVEAAPDVARLGPVARLLADRSDDEVKAVHAAIARVLPRYARSGPDGGVSFPAAVWVVTAASPG